MHDCPGCQTPLHGHESFCPVCGSKQQVRSEYQGSNFAEHRKSANPLPLILIVLLIGGLLVYGIQHSWIGELIKRGPVVEVEDTPATAVVAREKLENDLTESLLGQSSAPKFTYKCADKAVDRNCQQPVELTIDVRLKDPNKRHSIMDPVKALMVPAHINTLTLNEAHSGATLTYSVSGAGGTADATGENEGASPQPAQDSGNNQ